MNRPLNDAWFAAVDSVCSFWDRKDANNIVLMFNGYKHQDCYDAEAELMKLGGAFMDMKFDKQCGKTYCYVREPKAVVAERDSE